MPYQHYHFKCQITRKGQDYGISRENFTSLLHILGNRSEAEFMFFGSSPKSQIYIPGLAPQHVSVLLSKEHATIEALAPCEIITSSKKALEVRERVTMNLLDREKWDIVFPNQTRVACKIYDEMFPISPELKKTLEAEYEEIQKIWESPAFLSFKTKNGKALKVLQPSYVDKSKIVERFAKAAKSFQKLPSDNFLKINKIVCDSIEKPCYVEMDYLEGETLENYLAKRGILPIEEAKSIIKEIALRLCVLQEHGYCVRNLHPQNIIMCKDGKLRITGFFLLKDYSLHMTQNTDQMIIPNYSSPEQIQDPSRVDIYSDVFSLGAIFYALLLGEPPINAINSTQYMLQLTSSEPLTPEKVHLIGTNLSFDLCTMVASMLSMDQGRRPAPRKIVSALSGGIGQFGQEKKTSPGFFSKLLDIFKSRKTLC